MKNAITSILISVSALVTGYAAMALPFRLFEPLSSTGMKIIFIAEIIIYFFVVSIFLLIKDKKKENKEKEKRMKTRHSERVEKRRREMNGIKVNNYDLAA